MKRSHQAKSDALQQTFFARDFRNLYSAAPSN